MDRHLEAIRDIHRSNDKKILLIVLDGLGGLDHPDHDHRTEMQAARIPNLDEFVRDRKTETGMILTVGVGYTPGSSSGHFGLFGYDPLHRGYDVGRGAMEAADLDDMEFGPYDVIVRFNFCTVEDGRITDRRAGRTKRGQQLVTLLNEKIRIEGAVTEAVATREHRGILVLRDPDGRYDAGIHDTDPGIEGVAPLPARPAEDAGEGAAEAARIFQTYAERAAEVLRDQAPANAIVFRGFSRMPRLPQYDDVFGLRAVAIATYPLYRGVARLVGMTVAERASDLAGEADLLDRTWPDHEYFFLHYKPTDSKGEDGDFEGKVKALEEFDRIFPRILRGEGDRIRFDAVAVTGDHSTPAVLRSHSHHPVPVAVWAPTMRSFDRSSAFDEEQCYRGTLGQMLGPELMRLLLAATGKLGKFGG
jgi:2,3-bisphosphoglycerate-independent phosphoglycerate mutase